jgi:competence protein ComEA
MLKKVIAGLLIFATSSLFGMSLNKLNTASKAELMMINGIGEKKADAIIKERRKGKFKSFEDFQRVDGIGEETAKNVKNDVKIKKDVKETKKSAKKSTKKKAEKKKSSSKKNKTDKKKK